MSECKECGGLGVIYDSYITTLENGEVEYEDFCYECEKCKGTGRVE